MGRYADHNKDRNGNPKLSNLTVNISDESLDMLAFGISQGWWASRSEGVRVALGKALPKILEEKMVMQQKIAEYIEPHIETNLDPDKDYVKIPGRGYIEILGEA